MGIRLVYGDTSFVMTGDAEKEAEADMLASGENLQGDVWKAAHHGSSTSNTGQMLDAVQPTYAVISCGKDNPTDIPIRRRWKPLKREAFRCSARMNRAPLLPQVTGKA